MKRLIAAAATVLLLAACKEGASVQSNAANAAANEATSANAAAPAAAPLSKEAKLKLMHDRHENMEKIGKAMKAAKRAIDADPADLATVRQSADTIHTLAQQAQSWFPEGTGKDVGKTMAKAEIWQQPERFALNMKDFRDAAASFRNAAQRGNVAEIKTAQEALGKTCGACHDRFRAKKH